MRYYCEEREQVLRELESREGGLSAQEAGARLDKYGRNKLEAAKGKSLVRRFLEQLADPMILILLAAAVVSGVLAVVQNESFADAIIILAVVLINAVLGVYQESKAEKAIEALQEMAAATSKVLRDGTVQVVPSEELVPGDVILLEAGDAVPADARLLECVNLKVEEAALTGESVPVLKLVDLIQGGDGSRDIPLGDRKNMVYTGGTVVYGRGRAVVTATGMSTEMGKIAGALTAAEEEQTPLQRRLSELSRILTFIVLGICVVIFAAAVLKAGAVTLPIVLDSFMIAVSLAVAAIPEGLAAVVTVVLSIGVTNMSRRNAIIRRLTAVETLGCAQIICSDKTGTLTQNRMTVVSCFGDDEKQVAESFALCTDASLAPGAEASTGDPTQTAVVDFAFKCGLPKYELEKEHPRVGEIPFDSMRKLMTTVHVYGDHYIQHTTGAPDVVLGRCTTALLDGKVVELTDEIRARLAAENKKMADRALRVLASGIRTLSEKPEVCRPEEMEKDLCFLGLVGMIDPVRPEVKAAVQECREAGIRPVMITGDHVDTAAAIARELGILEEGGLAITGAQLSEMNDEEFDRKLTRICVYARVQPEHKTRIVNAWRKRGFVTAMTGDGVNDAPSIKAADIGIGMGITGTDVTKNVADMVLADDNFATIVGAVEEGRRIYDNIRKAIAFLLGSNMSEVLTIFLATLAGFTILKPVHLLWINLITDCFPALALGLEAAEKQVMHRAPRRSKESIFAEGLGVDVAYQGLLVTALVFCSFLLGHFAETGSWAVSDSGMGTTMAFLTMCSAEVFHSINMRSRRDSIFTLKSGNPLLFLAAGVSLAAAVAVCAIPPLAEAFSFAAIGWSRVALSVALGAVMIPAVELVKLIQRALRRARNK